MAKQSFDAQLAVYNNMRGGLGMSHPVAVALIDNAESIQCGTCSNGHRYVALVVKTEIIADVIVRMTATLGNAHQYKLEQHSAINGNWTLFFEICS